MTKCAKRFLQCSGWMVPLFLLLLWTMVPNLFAEEALTQEKQAQELEYFYNQLAERLTRLGIQGYPVGPTSEKLFLAYRRILGKELDEGVLLLKDVTKELSELEKRPPLHYEQLKQMYWGRLFKGILKYFLFIVMMALVLMALPKTRALPNASLPIQANAISWLLLTGTALLGDLLVWEGPFTEKIYFVEFSLLNPLLATLAGGARLGLAVGTPLSIVQMVLLRGPLGALPLLGPLVGWPALGLKKPRPLNLLALGSLGALLGLLQCTLVYHDAGQELGPGRFFLSLGFLTVLYGGSLLLFFSMVYSFWGETKRRHAETLLLETRFQQLQHQIRPHFLFNTLNTIAGLYKKEEAQQARALVLKLALLFRKLVNLSEPWMSLEETLSQTRLYLEIEQARFPGKIHFQIDAHTETPLSQIRVPILSIQPLVENAVKHGLRNKRGPGKIVVSILENRDSVQVKVSDDGAGMPSDFKDILSSRAASKADHAGVGLQNIHGRLMHLGVSGGLKIQSEPEKGTEVSFSLPKSLAYAETRVQTEDQNR